MRRAAFAPNACVAHISCKSSRINVPRGHSAGQPAFRVNSRDGNGVDAASDQTLDTASSQERFVSVSDLLAEVKHSVQYSLARCVMQFCYLSYPLYDLIQVKDLGEDFVFEDKDESTDVWGHEQRLRAQNSTGESAVHAATGHQHLLCKLCVLEVTDH